MFHHQTFGNSNDFGQNVVCCSFKTTSLMALQLTNPTYGRKRGDMCDLSCKDFFCVRGNTFRRQIEQHDNLPTETCCSQPLSESIKPVYSHNKRPRGQGSIHKANDLLKIFSVIQLTRCWLVATLQCPAVTEFCTWRRRQSRMPRSLQYQRPIGTNWFTFRDGNLRENVLMGGKVIVWLKCFG